MDGDEVKVALVAGRILFNTNVGLELDSTAAAQVVAVLVKLDKPPALIVYELAVAPA